MHSSRVFWVKPIGRLFYEVRKIRKPYDFLPIPILLSTIVLNDNQVFLGLKWQIIANQALKNFTVNS